MPDRDASGEFNEDPGVRKTELYNRQAGLRGRDGGPYLDELEAEHREKIAAHHEGRDFDPEKAKARLGGNLLTPPENLEDNTYSNPGSRGLENPASKMVRAAPKTEAIVTTDFGVSTPNPHGASVGFPNPGVNPGEENKKTESTDDVVARVTGTSKSSTEVNKTGTSK